MGKMGWDGEAAWNSTASTQDAYWTLFVAVDGTLTERLRVTSAGNVGIGTTSPIGKLSVKAATDQTLHIMESTNGNISGAVGLVAINDANNAYVPLGFLASTFKFITGGIQLGSPTGGDKGAGTINAAGDIYKNNSAYTNPDYVFEHEYTGKIVRFKKREGAAGYKGRLSVPELRDYTRKNLRLPGIPDGPVGMFRRGDIALEKIEELSLYIMDLHEEIQQLKAA